MKNRSTAKPVESWEKEVVSHRKTKSKVVRPTTDRLSSHPDSKWRKPNSAGGTFKIEHHLKLSEKLVKNWNEPRCWRSVCLTCDTNDFLSTYTQCRLVLNDAKLPGCLAYYGSLADITRWHVHVIRLQMLSRNHGHISYLRTIRPCELGWHVAAFTCVASGIAICKPNFESITFATVKSLARIIRDPLEFSIFFPSCLRFFEMTLPNWGEEMLAIESILLIFTCILLGRHHMINTCVTSGAWIHSLLAID